MKGKLIVYRPTEMKPHVVLDLDAAPGYELLHEHVGGYIETVPFFDKFRFDGKIHKCTAFVNENGKLDHLPYNDFGNAHWEWALRQQGKTLIAADGRTLLDHLVGPLVIIIGDDELLADL